MTRVVSDILRRPVFVQGGILGILLGLLYYPVFAELAAVWWNDPNYSHGFLIPFLSGYFIWERRERLQALAIMPNNFGAVVLVIGVMVFIMGSVGAGAFVLRFSLIVVIVGLILFLMGTEALKLLLFPIAFLILMIPLPVIIFVEITLPLQLLAAKIAAFSLQTLHIPVYREGNIIFLAHTTLEVVDACSGIRSLISLITLGTVIAYFAQQTAWKRIFLVLSTIPIAIAVNSLRVSGTGLLAHFFGAGMADGFYHTFSGLLLFALAFSLILGESVLLSRVSRKAR